MPILKVSQSNKGRKLICAAAMVGLLVLASAFVLKAFGQSTSAYEPDTLLAFLDPRSKADAESIAQAIIDQKASIVRGDYLKYTRLIKIKTAPGAMASTGKALLKNKLFVLVAPNWKDTWMGLKEASAGVNDPYFPSQWYLNAMNIPKAWALSTKPVSQYMALLDSGVTVVSDLQSKVHKGFSPHPNSPALTDVVSAGHGTTLASIAAAVTNNGKSIAAVNPNAYVYPIKIGDESGADDWAIARGLAEAMSRKIKIAVIGAGPAMSTKTLLDRPFVRAMLSFFYSQGGLVFAPAGNSGVSLSSSLDPALILVAATDRDGKLANFSNFGSPVWFGAPGVDIIGITKNGDSVATSGTSASAAIVAATASLIQSNNPNMSNSQILDILKASASGHGQRDSRLGYGIIDAESCMKAITSQRIK